MKFMIIVKATEESEAGVLPEGDDITRMAEYHEELVEAGVLRAAEGLQASSKGWRIRYTEAGPEVVDGPFPETKELIAGFTLIEVDSREEALEWSRRFPNPSHGGTAACEIEVRQVFGLDDFEPGEGVDRFRAMEGEFSG